MSRKGDCWDNAVAESFFHTLKVELIHRMRFATREQAKRMIFEYIVMYFNCKRARSTLGYLSPLEYEKRKKKNPLGLSKVRFEVFAEGAAAQIMPIGPFIEEGATKSRMT